MKLVATDMDGTLLDSRKRIPSRLYPVIRALREKGVRFAVASGRQYFTLLRDFPGIEDEIFFIAENGGIVFEGRENISVSSLSAESVRAAVEYLRRMEGVGIVLCGVQRAYVDKLARSFMENVETYCARYEILPDMLQALERDTICKIAIFDSLGAERNSYAALQGFRDRFNVNLAGESWVDMMAPGVSKGSAIRTLQNRLEIGPDDCMAFGDYLNDLEMMRECGSCWAMANAHPDLKAVCGFQAKSNDEDGVMEALVSYFHLQVE